VASGDVNGDGFDDVVVSAYTYTNDQSQEGRVYLYAGSADGLGQTPVWMAEGNHRSAELGVSLAVADLNGDGYDDIVVGSHNSGSYDGYPGQVRTYHGSPSWPNSTPSRTVLDPNEDVPTEFGWSVAAGELTGDQFADLIVGDFAYHVAWPDSRSNGRAYLFPGSESGVSSDPVWIVEGPNRSHLGLSVAAAGDVNRDGIGDLLVGGSGDYGGRSSNGVVLLFFGRPEKPGIQPDWIAAGQQDSDGFGFAVAAAGDVNGDGFSDILVGDNRDRAYIYYGSAGLPSATPDWVGSDGSTSWSSFGYSVAGAGDLDGDGKGEFLVGAWRHTGTLVNEGAAYLFKGASPPAAAPAWLKTGGQASAEFGYAVAGAGDVNGDGGRDVIVGAWGYTAGALGGEGRAMVFHGVPPIHLIDPACSGATVCNGEHLRAAGIDALPIDDFERLAAAAVYRKGAATDGVTQILLRKRSTASSVTFTLRDPSGAPAPAEWGRLMQLDGTGAGSSVTTVTRGTAAGQFAFALYRVPVDFPGGPDQVEDGVAVTLESSSAEGVSRVPLRLVPPPVVLVHGFWDPGGKTWTGLEADLRERGFFVCDGCRLDYGTSAPAGSFDPAALAPAGSFSVGTLDRATTKALTAIRNHGVAAAQVDVVGHSMGGLVARARAQSSQRPYQKIANYFQGFFHKIITVGTPHRGTRLATWLLQNRCRPTRLRVPWTSTYLTVEELLAWKDMPIGPAIYELQESSPILQSLGGVRIHARAIVGQAPPASCAETVLDRIFWLAGDSETKIDRLLQGDANHDTIVPLDSQRAWDSSRGLPHEIVPGVVHTRVSKCWDSTESSSPQVWQSVRDSLLMPRSMFSTPPRYFPTDPPVPLQSCAQSFTSTPGAAMVESLRLTPDPGTPVSPGERITVQFELLDGRIADGALFLLDGEFREISGTGPFETIFDVPTDRIGPVFLGAVTTGPGPVNDGLATYVVVARPDAPVGLEVAPARIDLAVPGEQDQIVVHGVYADGARVDLTRASTGTTYRTVSGYDTTVAAGPDGLVEARGSGDDAVLVSVAGLSAQVPVHVVITNWPPILSVPAEVTVEVGETIDVPLSAIDPEGGPVRFEAVNLPGFAGIYDPGGGLAFLQLAPGESDIGVHIAQYHARDMGLPPLGTAAATTITVSACARPAPAGSPSLGASQGSLSWTPIADATAYDLVYGDVRSLRESGAGFETATLACLVSSGFATTFSHAATPPVGEAFWYLVRGAGCGGTGTYDSGGEGQVGSRDVGIAASGADCW
jgi:hypothetical protein